MTNNSAECSPRAEGIYPFIVMDVLEKAKNMEAAGAHIIHLEIGEPDFSTPGPIKEAAAHALAEGYLRFSYANSIENIREGLDRLERFLSAR